MLRPIDDLITEALSEDMPDGDLTTDSLFDQPVFGNARLIAKEDLVLSGLDLFERTIRRLAPEMVFRWQFKNGDFVIERQTLCLLQGDLVGLLKAERVALNFLGRLSGIATLTRCFVNQVKHTSCAILDTRKTTPTLRALEKEAVRDGGGTNHRMNLSRAVLIKDNHLRAAGGLTATVDKLRRKTQVPVEVECTTLDEVEEAVELRVERILLDNMSNDMMGDALSRIPATIQTEASGNMTLERVKSVAELGVDFISIGALTHSAPTADISLLFEWPAREAK